MGNRVSIPLYMSRSSEEQNHFLEKNKNAHKKNGNMLYALPLKSHVKETIVGLQIKIFGADGSLAVNMINHMIGKVVDLIMTT